ncbi:hypothetical protein ACFE04_015434 [Oxalis oulophora]
MEAKKKLKSDNNKRKQTPQSSDFSKKPKKFHSNDDGEKKAPLTKKEGRIQAKALQKMKGKIADIAGSHVSSRVLQTCVKFCSKDERDSVYSELEPHFLKLSCNVYGVHLVKKMLDSAPPKQLEKFISSLHGHVGSLLRHMVGSVACLLIFLHHDFCAVVEHAYYLATPELKQKLMLELYSTELQLFKDLLKNTSSSNKKEDRLEDIISKLGISKGSVVRHMNSVVQPVLEKGILDHSVIHKLLLDYLSIADRTSAADVIQQLSGPLLIRMIYTFNGSKIGILCIKHGSAKERKKIIKGMKGHVDKIARDQYGSLVLSCIVSTVDDTKLVSKIIIRELQETLKELVTDKNGRRVLLQLLRPNSPHYFSPEHLETLNLSVSSLSTKGTTETKASNDEESNDKEAANSDLEEVPEDADENLTDGGKKDPSVRRQELLVDSGLAESLVDFCIESADKLLRSNFGKDVLYEIATGGSDGVLHSNLDDDKLNALNEAVASLAAKPKPEESTEGKANSEGSKEAMVKSKEGKAKSKESKEAKEKSEESKHTLENFNSSQIIRKLILDCPAFASVLWKKALKGKCDTWAEGLRSGKVLRAFLESSDPKVKKLAKGELQPLIDSGTLKIPTKPEPEKEN